jgi:hypothetical protein
MSSLPEAWIAPKASRELRELVRHRAKLVGMRSHCQAEGHAVLARCGAQGVDERAVRGGRHRSFGCGSGSPTAAAATAVATARRQLEFVFYPCATVTDLGGLRLMPYGHRWWAGLRLRKGWNEASRKGCS